MSIDISSLLDITKNMVVFLLLIQSRATRQNGISILLKIRATSTLSSFLFYSLKRERCIGNGIRILLKIRATSSLSSFLFTHPKESDASVTASVAQEGGATIRHFRGEG